MNDISVGAIGAAIIAGLVSILGLIIGKEQKVSEFRQAWIDDLRNCLIAYLVNINSISDMLRLKKKGEQFDNSALLLSYKLLNEANHGIALRINAEEKPAKALMKAMTGFESISSEDANLTPENIKALETGFLIASKELLKFEWTRVKRGEPTFVWTKWIVSGAIVAMLALLIFSSVVKKASGIDSERPQPDCSMRSDNIKLF